MKRNLLRLLILASIGLILLARLHVGLVRFFDPDEFAHLHWAWLIAQNKLPYQDFFFYTTPIYQWFLWPILNLEPSDRLLLLARLWEFGLYIINSFILFRIAKRTTKNEIASWLSLLIFVTFPMTFDKTIDIRPDMLMTALYFLAVERMLTWSMLTAKKSLTIGLLLGTSFLVFFKIIYALPAVLVLIIFQKKFSLSMVIMLSIGFLIPLGLFAVYLFANNLHLFAWEAFSHTQFVVNSGKEQFSLFAALSPWPLVYLGVGGVSFPWLVNMGIWISALTGLWIMWKQFKLFAMFSACFTLSAFLFLALFPAPYVQYFIPLSAVASLLSATAIYKIYHPIMLMIILSILPSFFLQYRERTTAAANNAEQLQVIRDVLTMSKPTDTFYDMVGSYVFRPDGYFICCHPYAEFVDKLKTKAPTLTQSLISNHTQFLILDRTGQSLWKPKKEDLDFLIAHYTPSKYRKIYVWNQ